MTKNNKVTVVEDDEAITAVPTEITFSAKDLATECGTDPKSFRRWLRTQTTDRANKGGRWVFTTDSKAAFLALYAARHDKGTEPTIPTV